MGLNCFYTILFSIFGVHSFGQSMSYVSIDDLEPDSVLIINSGVPELKKDTVLNLYLKGDGLYLLQWEAFTNTGSHPDTSDSSLKNKIIFGDSVVGLSEHATEMARLIVGQPVSKNSLSIAPGAIIYSFDLNDFWWEYIQNSQSVFQTFHPYATNNGWRFQENQFPFWSGLEEIDSIEDYNFGRYSQESKRWDSVLHQNPYLITVKSIGNERGQHQTGDHVFYQSINGSLKDYKKIVSKKSRKADGGLEGFDMLDAGACAKNPIIVGAVTKKGDLYKPSQSSNFGPTDDGRIKPDLVAFAEKTSHSAAIISGEIILLRELYQNIHGHNPLSCLLKNVLIHSADNVNNDGPNYQTGWGLVNPKKAAELIMNKDSSCFIIVDTIMALEKKIFKFYSNDLLNIKATICWTDPEGKPIDFALNPVLLNNRKAMLVNDIDLRIVQEKTDCKMYPFRLNPLRPSSPAKLGDNSSDNVEMVVWELPEQGWYKVIVSSKMERPTDKQVFSLIIRGYGF